MFGAERLQSICFQFIKINLADVILERCLCDLSHPLMDALDHYMVSKEKQNDKVKNDNHAFVGGNTFNGNIAYTKNEFSLSPPPTQQKNHETIHQQEDIFILEEHNALEEHTHNEPKANHQNDA